MKKVIIMKLSNIFQILLKYFLYYAVAYNNRGIVKGKLEDYGGEIQDYNKAIELKPDYALAYFNRGTAKGQLEDYKGSLQDFGKVIELNPMYAEK